MVSGRPVAVKAWNLGHLGNVESNGRTHPSVSHHAHTVWRCLMAERTLRGARLGGQSFEDERGIEFAARQQVGYRCPQAHEFEITMSVEADVPRSGSARAAAPRALSTSGIEQGGEGREAGPHPLGHAARASLREGARGHPQGASRPAARRRDRSRPPAPRRPKKRKRDRLTPARARRRRPRPGQRVPVTRVRGDSSFRPARPRPIAPGSGRSRSAAGHQPASSRAEQRPGERQDQQDADTSSTKPGLSISVPPTGSARRR